MSRINRRDLLKLLGSAAVSSALPWGCGNGARRPPKPNILWIVWDTARRDRLGPGGRRPSPTPFLDDWARQARVFDDCLSAAGFTVPSHASMFTGFMPSEHRCFNTESYFADEFSSIAERLAAARYRTYLFSANPHISKGHNFTQGFDRAEHPWDEGLRSAALRILQEKLLPEDESHELREKLDRNRMTNWMIKACGRLARQGLEQWLADPHAADGQDDDRPWFAFLNYMEAHRPYLPPRQHRERVMTPEQVEASYRVDRSWDTMWRYTFGRGEYSAEELELTRLTYDAALAELDDLLRDLLAGLETAGHLENTVVILTSDHGELLGEHHMLDHQYSVHEPLIRVPLIVHAPGRLQPGRESRPVMNIDLFPTILELAGVERPAYLPGHAVSLLAPAARRLRVAECPDYPDHPFRTMRSIDPTFDPKPWSRTLTAVYDGEYKYIRASDGRHALHHLTADPGELENLIDSDRQTAARMETLHREWATGLTVLGHEQLRQLSEEETRRLRALGYMGPDRE